MTEISWDHWKWMPDYIMALLSCWEMKYMGSYCPLNYSCIFPQNLWIISDVQYIWFLYLMFKAGSWTPPTWKQINIYQKYASPLPAFSPASTICCLVKNKKKKIFYWAYFFLMWAWSYTVKISFLRGVQNQNNQI